LLPADELWKAADRPPPALPIGIDEAHLAPVYLNPTSDPHLVIFGDAECGKTNLLRLIARTLVERQSPAQARLVIVDYRRTLLGVVEGDHLLEYAPSAQVAEEMVEGMYAALSKRLPGSDVTSEQLRHRSWWTGPEIYFLVDDYDMVAGTAINPLAPLVELLPQARDIGMHVIVARRSGGAGRALYDPLLQRLRELDSSGILMSGNRDEGVLLGNIRPGPQPPGRGSLVRRSDGVTLVQTAYLPEPS
jgi:S-DNA-T family DNA segregation ATPase FtsK/SpoIIIE